MRGISKYLLGLVFLWAPSAFAYGSSGPVQTITTLAQLRTLSMNGNYKLGGNIDASATQNAGQAFVPLGTSANPFRGTLDGGNFAINNLRIDSSGPATGLFTYATGAWVHHVGLTNVSVTGHHQTGGFIGVGQDTMVEYSYVTGAVRGRTGSGPWLGVGMLVGTAYGGTVIRASYATGSLTGPVQQGGGIVGSAFGFVLSDNTTKIHECFANVTVTPTVDAAFTGRIVIGGIVGVAQAVDLQHALTLGTFTARAPAYVGGVIGSITALDGIGSIYSYLLTRGVVNVTGGGERAGAIGFHDGNGQCDTKWDSSVDGGTPRSDSTSCQAGHTSSELKSPTFAYGPFCVGTAITDPSHPMWPACSLGRWADDVWNYNGTNQHNTLKGIPDEIQPK